MRQCAAVCYTRLVTSSVRGDNAPFTATIATFAVMPTVMLTVMSTALLTALPTIAFAILSTAVPVFILARGPRLRALRFSHSYNARRRPAIHPAIPTVSAVLGALLLASALVPESSLQAQASPPTNPPANPPKTGTQKTQPKVPGGIRGDTISIVDYRFPKGKVRPSEPMNTTTANSTPYMPPPVCMFQGAPADVKLSSPICTPCTFSYAEAPGSLWQYAPSCVKCDRPGMSNYWLGGASCTSPRELVSVIRSTTAAQVGFPSSADGSSSYAKAGAYPITTCLWRWGDNAQATIAAQGGTCAAQTHAYAAPGTYTVTLTVSNGGRDLQSTSSAQIAIVGAIAPPKCTYVDAPESLLASDATCQPCGVVLAEGPNNLWSKSPACSPCTVPGYSSYWSQGTICKTAPKGYLYISHTPLFTAPFSAGGFFLNSFADLGKSFDARNPTTFKAELFGANANFSVSRDERALDPTYWTSSDYQLFVPTTPGSYVIKLTVSNGYDNEGVRLLDLVVAQPTAPPCMLQGAPNGMLSTDVSCKPCSARFSDGSTTLYQFAPTCTPCTRPGMGSNWSGGPSCVSVGTLYANLSASATSVSMNSPVTIYYSASTGSGASPATSYALTVPSGKTGGGTYSSGGNITHTFTTAGVFTYNLVVSNTAGDTPGYATLSITVTNGGDKGSDACTLVGSSWSLLATDPACSPCSSKYLEGPTQLWSQSVTCTPCTRPTLGNYSSEGPTCQQKRPLVAKVTAQPNPVKVGINYTIDACASTAPAPAYPIQTYKISVNGETVLNGASCGPITQKTNSVGTDVIELVVSNGIDLPGTATTSVTITPKPETKQCSLKDSPSGLLATDPLCKPCDFNTAYWAGSVQCNSRPDTFILTRLPNNYEWVDKDTVFHHYEYPDPLALEYSLTCFVLDWSTSPVQVTCNGSATMQVASGFAGDGSYMPVDPFVGFHLIAGQGTTLQGTTTSVPSSCVDGFCGPAGMPETRPLIFHPTTKQAIMQAGLSAAPRRNNAETRNWKVTFWVSREEGNTGRIGMPYRTFSATYSAMEGEVAWDWKLVKTWH